MRTALLLSALALLPCAVPAATEATPSPPRTTLNGADCLDPTAARSWDYVSGTELLVDAGRRKYRVVLAEYCTDLGYGADIRFKGDSIGGRVCGNVGEKVQVNARMSCRIERIEIIDAETYRAATDGTQGTESAKPAED
jgi:hypothetical protein